jgi:CBS domain-containing protein
MPHAPITHSPLTGVEVGAVMSTGVVTAPASAAPEHVAATMAAHAVHAIVVIDNGPPRVRTDLDVLAAVLNDDVSVHRSESGVPEVGVHAPLSAAIEALVRHDTSHLLVCGERGVLPVGVLSSFDVAAVVAGREPRIARLTRPTAARPALSESRLSRLIVGDVMHVGIVGVGPQTSLRDLAAVIADWRVHAVSVAGVAPDGNGGRLVWAIATDLDVTRAVAAGSWDTTAQHVAGTEPLMVDAGDDLDEAARLLVQHDVSHAIVAEGGAAVGVLSTLDILRVVAIAAG